MAAGNNTLEETFGLVAAGTEILREPGRVANGLSTITARLTKKNDEYIKSITGGQGVIDEQTGELRSTYAILKDLSEAWGNLTSVEQQELTETVAGKTQRSLFTAIMTNFETAVGATEAALNSEGSALAENTKRMDSLEGKTKQLQSAWQELARTTINSDFIKGILTVTTGLVKLTDTLGGIVPLATTLLSIVIMFKSQQIGKKIDDFSKSIVSLINGFKILKQRIFGATNANVIYLGSAESAQVATTGLAASMSALSLAIGATTAVISIIIMAVNALEQSAENYRQKQEELSDDITKQAKEMESLKDTYASLTAKQHLSDLENKKLQSSIDTLINKYGLSEEALKGENKTREQVIEYLEKEISLRERQAALAQTGSAKFGIGEKEALLSGEAISYSLKNFDKYVGDLSKENLPIEIVGKDLQDLTNKIYEQIIALQNKNEKTKVEELLLAKLTKDYTELTSKVDNWKKAYQKSSDVLSKGLGISNEEVQILKQLGLATETQVGFVRLYNKASEDQKKVIEEAYQKYLLENNIGETLNDTLATQKEEKEKATTAAQSYSQALDGNIDSMINYGENLDLLKTAQEELSNSGAITAETFKSLADNNLLGYLDEVNGKLSVNVDRFTNSTNSIKEQALANLQASTYEQIHAIVLEDLNNKEKDTKTASEEAASGLKTTGEAAINMGKKLISAAGDAAQLNSELAVMAGKSYTPSEDAQKRIQDVLSRAAKTQAFINSWTPSTSKAASKSSSSKDSYKAEVDTLYKYENALDNAKDAVDRLNDALKATDNFNEREKYLKQLIKATKDEIKATNNLRKAQTNQINDYIKQLKRQGFQISYNSKTNQLNINNMERLGKFTGDTAKNLEKMIDKVQDLNKNNRTLDGSVRDLNSDISDFNDQLEALPEEKLKKFNELLEAFQQSRLDQIQNQIDDIQHEMENDPRLKALEEQINALEKQNDELDNQKDLEEKLLAVEEAKIKLQNAQKQKNIQIYREGQGFVWEADPDEIQSAADELQEAQDNLNDKIKQDEIDRLNAEKEALENSYQNRIDALQNFLDEQNYLIDKANREGIQTFEELQKKMAEFGLDNAENLKTATDWLNNYNKSLSDLNKTVGDILSSSTNATDGLIYSSSTQDRISNALSSIMPKIDANTGLTLSNVKAETKTSDNNTGSIYINSIELPNVKDVDDFIEALKDLPRLASSQSTLRK